MKISIILLLIIQFQSYSFENCNLTKYINPSFYNSKISDNYNIEVEKYINKKGYFINDSMGINLLIAEILIPEHYPHPLDLHDTYFGSLGESKVIKYEYNNQKKNKTIVNLVQGCSYIYPNKWNCYIFSIYNYYIELKEEHYEFETINGVKYRINNVLLLFDTIDMISMGFILGWVPNTNDYTEILIYAYNHFTGKEFYEQQTADYCLILLKYNTTEEAKEFIKDKKFISSEYKELYEKNPLWKMKK